MRRRNVILGILALVVCGVLAVMFWPEKPEPVYKGKKLSEWVLMPLHPTFGVVPRERIEAIHAIGTNGIPFYLEWIRDDEPGLFQRAEFMLADKVREWLHMTAGGIQRRASRPKRALAALGALEVLGDRAATAIPQLLARATNSAKHNPDLSPPGDPAFFIGTLARIGPRAVPAYLCVLTNPDPRLRSFAILQSQAFDDSAPLIPQIESMLNDPDQEVRTVATNVLRAQAALRRQTSKQ